MSRKHEKIKSGNCPLCGTYREFLVREHIVPQWKFREGIVSGNANHESNIQYICDNCHADKTRIDVPREKRREATLKSAAKQTPEQRRSWALNASMNLSPEQRKLNARNATVSLTREQRRENGRKGAIARIANWASLTLEQKAGRAQIKARKLHERLQYAEKHRG
jgi:hypothetical protein